MSIKTILPLALCVLIFSCKQETITYSENMDFSITSPKAGWTYYEDTRIMLSVNVNTANIKWSSDIAGYLGTGNHLTSFLPNGLHRISAEIRGHIKEQIVYVSPNAAGTQTVLVNYAPLEIKAKNGNCYSYLYTHDGSVEDFKISSIKNAVNAVPAYLPRLAYRGALHEPCRDVRLSMPHAGKRIDRISRRSLTGNGYDIGDKRDFFVINTKIQTGPPHQVKAKLIYQSDTLSIWISESSVESDGELKEISDELRDKLLDECVETVETLVIPRVEALWGKAADINGDGRIALLFSPSINNEEKAYGFFNPADFFERNTDILADSYNPSSNEIDIIYAALPDSIYAALYKSDPNSDNSKTAYSTAAIVATIAHELTHAATFTVKTWSRIKSGNTQAQREELFLDEGWSHLTENLCGLGISGGNIKFLETFFKNPSGYSFCGQDDTWGMRGAITLFLSWLFWEAGGMSWDSSNPVTVIDQGGISFLKKMVESPDTGWESIGKAFGKPTGQLFNELLDEMHNYRLLNISYTYKTDPFTNEAVDFFVNMREIIDVDFPKPSSAFTPASLLPWSFVFLEEFIIQNDSLLVLASGSITGNTYYSLTIRK